MQKPYQSTTAEEVFFIIMMFIVVFILGGVLGIVIGCNVGSTDAIRAVGDGKYVIQTNTTSTYTLMPAPKTPLPKVPIMAWPLCEDTPATNK